MTPAEQYDAYTAGADLHDRRRFDAYLLGYLFHAADDETRKAALEAAAVVYSLELVTPATAEAWADVNGARA
jgi:hypothetical protein